MTSDRESQVSTITSNEEMNLSIENTYFRRQKDEEIAVRFKIIEVHYCYFWLRKEPMKC